MKCHCSLFPDFKNGDKNPKTFLKGEKSQLLQIKVYRKKTIIFSNINKMQPLPNASKWCQAIPAGSLKKREPSIKHTKNKLTLVTEVDQPKTSSLVKPNR